MAELQEPIPPTRLYRYRSLIGRPKALREEIDSIEGKYLYCSEFTKMNDPMEGFYEPSKLLKGKSNYNDIVRQITASKSGVGIACFTETYENSLMWTHYAGNYSGICLSYSTKELLDGLPCDVNLVRLAYVDKPPRIYPSHVHDVASAAVRILSQKQYNWAYEREWRVLGPVGPVSMGSSQAIKRIYFGSRVLRNHREAILESIKGTNIATYMMDVDGYEHTWERIKTSSKPKKKLK